jgi:hypothetical protein
MAFTQAQLIAAFNAVFKVPTFAMIADNITNSPSITYVQDRLKLLLQVPPHTELSRDSVCANLDDDALLRVLFRAVAGDYITGASTLDPGSTPSRVSIVSDAVTGYLTLQEPSKRDTENILTAMCVILLGVLFLRIYKQAQQPVPSPATTPAAANNAEQTANTSAQHQ